MHGLNLHVVTPSFPDELEGSVSPSEHFETEIIAHQHVLLDAVAVAGMSSNAVEALDVGFATVPKARVRWPSYFCTQADYVRVLAYLLQNNLPFDLEVAAPAGGGGRYQLHPPLDAHTAELLSRIDPRQAALMAGMQDQVAAVFERLRRAGIDGDPTLE